MHGQAVVLVTQASEATEQRHVMRRFFHGQIVQRKPLLHELDAQLLLHRKRRKATFAFWHVGSDQLYQFGPSRSFDAACVSSKFPTQRSPCFMGSMSSGNHAGATDVFGRFIQAFRTITRM